MKELALHILDIAQNSIAAKASVIIIHIIEDISNDKLEINIEDNGTGMDANVLERALDPFYTSRKTRRVGLGLPLFQAAAQQCGGDLYVASEKNRGTSIKAVFKHSHIDRAPIGNMADTLVTLIQGSSNIDFLYTHEYADSKFSLDTKEIKEILKEVDITDVSVLMWLKDYIDNELRELVK